MNTQQLADHLGNLTIQETIALTRELEQRWGVTATPLMAPVINTPGRPGENDVVEQVEFTVELTSIASDQKVSAIKAVREALGLGLKEAKEFVEAVPKVLKEGISKADADQLRAKFTEIGATAIVR